MLVIDIGKVTAPRTARFQFFLLTINDQRLTIASEVGGGQEGLATPLPT